MPTAILSPSAKQQFFTDGSTVAAGYRLYTYLANTPTPAETYLNRAGTTPNQNPIILNARGEATIYLQPGVVYDYVLKTDQDVTVWTQEDVVADAGDSNAVTFTQAGAGAKTQAVQAKLRNIRHVTDFEGVDPTGVTDSTAGLQAAIDACAGKDLIWPPGGYLISNELVISAALRMLCPIGSVELRQATPNTNHIRIGDGTAPTRAATLETVIEGFIFIPQPGTAASTGAAMIKVQYAANFHFRNCVFYGRDSFGKKSWNAIELDRAEDSRIVDCKALEMRNNALATYGAPGAANRTVDIRIEGFRAFNCDGHQIEWGPHTAGMFLTNWICLGVAENKSGLLISADPTTEQGTNYFIVNPNVEVGNLAGSQGITVSKGQAVDILGGWIGGVAPPAKAFHFAIGSSSCSMKGTRVDGGQSQIDGAACSLVGVEFSGFGADTVGLVVTTPAVSTIIDGCRFRQFTQYGIDLQGDPQKMVIDGCMFGNITTNYINNANYIGGPSVNGIRSDVSSILVAAATLPIDFGQTAYQVTGGTTITSMKLLSPGTKISVQAGAGGLTWNSSGTLILKATPAAQPAFSLMEFTMIGGTWYETSRSF